MDQSGDVDQDLRELIRSDLRDIVAQQKTLEEKIVLLLLPRDPNDDRNVMLEIRAGFVTFIHTYILYVILTSITILTIQLCKCIHILICTQSCYCIYIKIQM